MFEFFSNDKRREGTRLSLSFYDDRDKKSYEVSYESCYLNHYARVKMLDEYRDKMNCRFKHWISNERFDKMVGAAIRNGFFSLKPLYQGEVSDNFKYVITLSVGNKSHTVTDSFGAAPEWLREFERLMMKECIEE